ncbi:MAG TPA: phytanoyl-CoA dioxygenase family protein [Opitutus sp.]|nr:phytanoyl-CoA dioxygenase family protein [Opitutus sp.]
MNAASPGAMAGLAEGVEVVRGRQFCEREYLEMNPDVRAAVKTGAFASGREHFERHGLKEGRLGRTPEHAAEFFGELAVDVRRMRALRAENFPYAGPHPWLDRPEWQELLQGKLDRGELTAAEADGCRFWSTHGYLILANCVEAATIDAAWAAYEAAIARGDITLEADPGGPGDPWPGRYQDAHDQVPELCAILRHPEILRWLGILMDREPAPYQTLTSHKGTQQPEHSDSIHMTTYPLGYLTAAWVALEDIGPDCGPLVYYPGTHRLPYVFSRDVGIADGEFTRSRFRAYSEKYEPFIQALLQAYPSERKLFTAKKGDVLIWHANLLHGGSKRNDLRLSRRSIVCHYFVKGAVTYHDLSGAAAHEHTGTCMLRADHA